MCIVCIICIYIYICIERERLVDVVVYCHIMVYYIILYYSICQGRAVQSHDRGPEHPEGQTISRLFLDFAVRAVLNGFPYDISLRSELGNQNIYEKI